ncbi:hypothetical protein [Streptomyces justiciae]|uniref:hypothetical protein n=1 Tax=Streptomyces justiciae TaxID=2780140 RepID=UPI0018817070|nr:hypothetical protein [Streptomyces justiciae]MBE8478174.1 hypothetical protein [Streptomyces justiciae]MCW8375796.1 hypothetical protein [Streptomyces justiciae]
MNRRPKLLAAAALTAVAALSLSACGGDDDSAKGSDKIAGADTAGDASASPTASASTASDRPKIELPSDLTYTFEWPTTGDEDKDAVLADSEQFIKAVDMAIAEQDPLNKAYRYYSDGEAAAGSKKFIQEFVDYKDRITGAKRYYSANVKINSDGTAGFVYCEDQNKAYNKSLKTGKTDVTPASKDNYVLYNSRLRVNKQGVWITETLTSQRGSAACQS